MKMYLIRIVAAGMLAMLAMQAWSQKVLLDEPVKAGPLTVFPSIDNNKNYYYVTDKPRIATGANGKPQFSFLKYVDNNPAAKEGDGGGIVHAVIVLEVTEQQRREAQQELQRIKPGATLVGPILFNSGTIALISSIAQPNGEFAKQVLGIGKAPILDGHKAAVSVQLTKKGANILWESFKTPTPDMSISFEMVIQGYRSPKRVLIEANFEQIYESKTMQLAAATSGPVLFSGEIVNSFEDLRKTGAIKVTQIGEDEGLEKALECAYTKLINMMFDPAGGTGSPSLGQLTSGSGVGGSSLLDRTTQYLRDERRDAQRQNTEGRRENRDADERAAQLERERAAAGGSGGAAAGGEDASLRDDVVVGPRRRPLSSRYEGGRDGGNDQDTRAPQVEVPRLAVMASFQMKKIRQQGIFKIDLNKYTVDNLSLRFDENFGQIDCPECFREANIQSPIYLQREVTTYLDGFNSEDFGKYINFANVTIRKKHEGGEITDQEVRIDKSNFNEMGNAFNVIYGWKNDNNRTKWLDYDYKVTWNYFGGFTHESPWIKTNIGTVPVSSPYVRKFIEIEADPDVYAAEGVRSAEVKISYMLGTVPQVKSIRLNPKGGQLSGQIDVLMPASVLKYEYEITWILNTGATKTSGKKEGTNSILFADTL